MPLCTTLLQMKVDTGHIYLGHTFSGGKSLFLFHAVSRYRWYDDTGITKSWAVARWSMSVTMFVLWTIFVIYEHSSCFISSYTLAPSWKVVPECCWYLGMCPVTVFTFIHRLIQPVEQAMPLQIVQHFTPHSLVWFLHLIGPKWKYPISPFVTLNTLVTVVGGTRFDFSQAMWCRRREAVVDVRITDYRMYIFSLKI